VRRRITTLIAIIQSILLVGHWFLYVTLVAFWRLSDPAGVSKLQMTLATLSVSFVAASLLAFRYSHFIVRLFYTISAAWLGILSFSLLAAFSSWILYAGAELFGFHLDRRRVATALFSLAVIISLYGMINAARTRVTRVTVKLPNLPDAWRGRTAAFFSDTHLGHVRNYGFMRRVITMVARLRPDIVFIAGDLYDGTSADLNRLAEPLAQLSPPLGAYFVTGNHEEFVDRGKYLAAVRRTGIRILENEKVTVDGLQIVGVHFRESATPERFRSILQQASLDRHCASILVTHTPHWLGIAEEEGISLQLSGHTHRGQFFPWTLIVARIYGLYAYGLQRFGNLLVYTSSGAGTWGPPLRVGTDPEVVLIRFE
jgi:uncharacterized protein